MSAVDPPLSLSVEQQQALGRRALRKASLHLLPLLGVAYGVAYIDRANVSYAALQMNQALHFSASIYGLGAGLFFISYALFEVPSNLLLVRFGARRWLARILATWGVLAMAMLLVRTPMQFYVMRFLLGAAEAGFFPGLIFYLMLWFPTAQRARSISRFYVAFPLSSALMGGVAGTLLGLGGRLGLAGWQWLFLLEGLPAVLLGVIFLLRLPDGPASAPWLSADERDWILHRIAQEQAAIAQGQLDSWRVWVREPRLWMMVAFYFCIMTGSYSYTLYAPAILTQLTQLGPAAVGWLISGANLLGAAVMVLNASHSDRTGERCLHIAIPILLVGLGYLTGGLTTRAWIGVPALSLAVIAYSATIGIHWTIPSTFLSGRSAASGIATINSLGMLGAFAGPALMGAMRDHTGTYQRGLVLLTVPSLLAVATMLWMRPRMPGRRV
jgi:ACS family tartrate transporter-like MFS transporter